PPKLEDVTSEAAELFSGPLILHSLILYYIQERRVKTKNRRLKGKCQRRATEPPRPRGVPWVPQLVSELQNIISRSPAGSNRQSTILPAAGRRKSSIIRTALPPWDRPWLPCALGCSRPPGQQ